MEDEVQFRRLAAFIRAWFGVSLGREGRQFAIPEFQEEWVNAMAHVAAAMIEMHVASREISRKSVENLDQSLELHLAAIFGIQANLPLMPYSEFVELCECKVALAVEMLTPKDAKILEVIVKQGENFDLVHTAQLLGVSTQEVIAAWGRIQDTLSVDPAIVNWLFGGLI